MQKKIIIGITGTLGAGKGTVAEYLVKEKGFSHFSARSFLVPELNRRGMPVNLDTLRDLANELREKYGPSHIAEKLIEMGQGEKGGVVIESLRAIGEAEKLFQARGVLVSVVADQKIRYERICRRGSETDFVSFKEFQEQEARQMSSTDPAKQNIVAVMEMADVALTNNGTLEELYKKCESALQML